MAASLPSQRMSLARARTCPGWPPRAAIDLMTVQETAMKRAAGTPLPETSAMTMPIRSSSISITS